MCEPADEHGGLAGSCWHIRHRLKFCVLQKRHALLVHEGEVVLELKTELQPGSLIVIIRSRSCSKFSVTMRNFFAM